MRIMDYETRREISDVAVTLTVDEIDELMVTLRRLKSVDGLRHVHLSEVGGNRLERELTVVLAE